MDASGLTRNMKYKHKPRTINEVIKRFELLQGSIDAGNDSQVVINESIELLKILVIAGKVDADVANEIINSNNEI